LFVRNTVIAALLVLGADVVAGFFEEPGVAPLLRVLAVSVLVDGFASIAIVLFEKRLEFKKRFAYRMSGLLTEFVVMVGFAFVYRSVWAFVVGTIAGAAAMVIASYAIGRRRPRFLLSKTEFRSLFGYGKWLTASSILIFFLLYGGDIVVGKLLGAAMLGYYQFGFRISNLPVTSLTSVLSGVMFPALSSIQEQASRVASLYVRSVRLTVLVTAPALVLLIPLAHVLIVSLAGEKWLPAVPVVRLLAVAGLCRSIGGTTGPIFLALGRPDIRTKIQVIQLLIYAVVLFPLANAMGIVGVALAAVIYSVVMNAVAVVHAVRLCGLRLRRLAEPVLVPVLSASAAGAVVWLLESRILTEPTVGALVLLAAAGGAVYVAVVAVVDRVTGNLYRREFLQLLSALRGSGRSS
jgi:PST family polysaccharide transporter/lipopolysaccharide exporter